MRERQRRWTRRRAKLGFVVTLFQLLAISAPASALTFNVDRTDDPDPTTAMACTAAASDCSLRGAIEKANSTATADIINVPAGEYTLDATRGSLEIDTDMTINGVGAGTGSCDPTETCIEASTASPGDIGAADFPVFVINDGMVTLSQMTIRHGGTTGIPFDFGGGIVVGTFETSSSPTLNLDQSVVGNNAGGFFGGNGIANLTGTVHLTGTSVAKNDPLDLSFNTGLCGGGILNFATLTLDNSFVGYNTAVFGGGVCNLSVPFPNAPEASFTLSDSDIVNNFAFFGGGIWNDASVLIAALGFPLDGHVPVDARLTVNQGSGVVENFALVGGGLINTRFPFLLNDTVGPDNGFGAATATFQEDSTVNGNQAYIGGGAMNAGFVLPLFLAEGGSYGGLFNFSVGPGNMLDGANIELGDPNSLSLSFDGSHVDQNEAYLTGGISNVAGVTSLVGSTVSNNHAGNVSLGPDNLLQPVLPQADQNGPPTAMDGFGLGSYAGIFNSWGTVTLDTTTVDSNIAFGFAGGIGNDGGAALFTLLGGPPPFIMGPGDLPPTTLTINRSTISNNLALNESAGVDNSFYSSTTATNSTFSGNIAGTDAGAIGNYALGEVHLNNVTITNNTAGASNSFGDGGGIFEQSFNLTILVKNSIIAGNHDDATGVNDFPDCANGGGTITSLDYNLIGIADGCEGVFTEPNDQAGTDVTPIDPQLGPLADNGGPTLTHDLLGMSNPALNQIPLADCTDADSNPISVDQRGITRPQLTPADGCDVGAVEATCGDDPYLGTPTCDDDGDGVLNGTETGGPNGGDANNDGTPDGTQSYVTTLPAAVGSSYLTVEVPPGMGSCSQLLNVKTLTPPAPGDPQYSYPFGMVSFEIDGCPGPVPVTVILHGGAGLTAPLTYRKFGHMAPNYAGPQVFYTLPGVVFGTTFVTGEGMVPTAMFSLTDNQLGDDNSTANIIVDPSGPAVRLVAAAPVVSQWALLALAIMLCAGAWWTLSGRRRLPT